MPIISRNESQTSFKRHNELRAFLQSRCVFVTPFLLAHLGERMQDARHHRSRSGRVLFLHGNGVGKETVGFLILSLADAQESEIGLGDYVLEQAVGATLREELQ